MESESSLEDTSQSELEIAKDQIKMYQVRQNKQKKKFSK